MYGLAVLDSEIIPYTLRFLIIVYSAGYPRVHKKCPKDREREIIYRLPVTNGRKSTLWQGLKTRNPWLLCGPASEDMGGGASIVGRMQS